MLSKIIKLGEDTPLENMSFNGVDFIHSKAPISQVEDNMKVVPQVAANIKGDLNLTEF